MALTFGLDIGIASVGWAVIDTELESPLQGMGVRVFDAGELPGGGSKKADRRKHRGARVRLDHMNARLNAAQNLLISEGLLAEDSASSVLGSTVKGEVSPWQLRYEGLDRPLTDMEWAKVLMHFNTHRGFKSNRKETTNRRMSKKERDKEKTALLQMESNLSLFQSGGYRTVGEMVWCDAKFADHKRNKAGDYTHSMLQDELKKEIVYLFECQQAFGNLHSSDSFRDHFITIFTSRRPVDSGLIYGMVGYCSLEPTLKRAAKHSYSAERFLLLSKLVNLRIQHLHGRAALTQAEIAMLLDKVHSNKTLNYGKLRQWLALPDTSRFVMPYDKDKVKKALAEAKAAGLSAEETQAKLKEEERKFEKGKSFGALTGYHAIKDVVKAAAGPAAWDTLFNDLDTLDEIGEILSWTKSPEQSEAKLLALGLAANLAEALSHLSFEFAIGHCRAVVRKLNPFLEQGMTYDKAVVAAGYQFNGKADPEDLSEFLAVLDLSHITNPVVKRSLTQARKVLNAMIRTYGSPSQINIELARDLPLSSFDRKSIVKEQKAYQDEKVGVVKFFTERYGRAPRRDELTKFRLWSECNYCPYTGQYLDPAKLLEPGYAEIDHILPESRSFDDSMLNKVLCTAKANQDKQNRTPFEWFGSDTQRWYEFKIAVQARITSKPKMFKLLKEDFSADNERKFREKHLTDTRYATKEFRNILIAGLKLNNPQAGNAIRAVNGGHTAFLRNVFGLGSKNRATNTHHAVDAVLIACATDSMVKRISDFNRKGELFASKHDTRMEVVDTVTGEIIQTPYKDGHRERFPLPWATFKEDILDGENQVFVSWALDGKRSGELHDQTVRSIKRLDQGLTSLKTKLTDLSRKDLEMIPDKDGRNRHLYQALRSRMESGLEDPFAKPLYLGKRGKEVGKGEGVLVRTVNINRVTNTGVLVQGGLADNGRMFRVDVFTKGGEFYVVPIYLHHKQLPNKAITSGKPESEWIEMDATYEFLFSLRKGDLVEVQRKKDPEPLLRYYKGTDRSGGTIELSSHDSLTVERPGYKTTLKLFRKLSVDVLGNITEVKKETRIGLA